jgi:hypothetical protein
VEALLQAQRKGYARISQAAAAGLILVPLLLWAVALAALWPGRVVKRSLVRLAAAAGIVLAAGSCLVGGAMATTGVWSHWQLEAVFIPLAAACGLGVLAFAIYAWVKRDPAAKFFVLLTFAWGALLGLLALAAGRGVQPNEKLFIATLLAGLLVPGAFILFGQGRWVQARRFVGGVSTAIGVLSALPALAVLPFFFLAARAPMAPMEVAVEREVIKTVEKEVLQVQADAGTDQAAGAEAPRLRQYFPETLYWAPEVTTDGSGFVSLQVPMADSITTWRLTALASSQDGRLGFATRGIRVFQDFFVDIDLPVSLTQGDEISIPVGVFNYLPEAQEVRLAVQPDGWFELLGAGERTLTIAANDIEVVYFPIRATRFGQQGFQVTAWGAKMSDAIRRPVRVVPDGKEIHLTESDWLRESKELIVDIPAQAVPEASRVEVKIYPGVMAQAIEGLEKILRLPHG